MPTKNPRINVTFEKELEKLLSDLAKAEHKSVSSLVRELTLEALDRREDMHLSALAEKLDKADVNTVDHDEAWK